MISVQPGDEVRTLFFNNLEKLDFPLLTIGKQSYINNMRIDSAQGNEVLNIQIGNYCSIAYNVLMLINRNHDYKSISTSPTLNSNFFKIKQKGQIIIGNDVWIGNDVIILSGVTIGDGAVIGAGSVISKDVPPYSIVVGNPQQIIKYRFDLDQINELLNIRWWNWDNNYIDGNKDLFKKDIDEFIKRASKKEKSITTKEKDITVKSMVYIFIPDFDMKYPIWEKVITEYLNKYSNNEDVTLLLWCNESDKLDGFIEALNCVVNNIKDCPDLLLITDDLLSLDEVFLYGTSFITTRSVKTMEYVEYARMNNLQIISGVDIPVF